MYVLMISSALVFVYFGSKVKYEEDITRLLPSSSVESELAFSSIGLKDKIFIQITSSGDRLSAEELADCTDVFVEMLQERDPDGIYIDNILSKVEPETALMALDFVLGHIPSFIDTSAYRVFDAVTTPEAIGARMDENLETILADMTGDDTQAIGYDPLNLRAVVIGDLLSQESGGLNLVDGHFFCPDSSVTISYLAPAFKSLDSWKARDFNKVIAGTVKDFEEIHPEVKVLYHGDPIGSVSNAGCIRRDLVLTVGISLVLILLLLGIFFKGWSFVAKLLCPIIYGTFFALACVWWI